MKLTDKIKAFFKRKPKAEQKPAEATEKKPSEPKSAESK